MNDMETIAQALATHWATCGGRINVGANKTGPTTLAVVVHCTDCRMTGLYLKDVGEWGPVDFRSQQFPNREVEKS